MINELFEGREDRTIAIDGSRYLVFPLNDISCISSEGGSPGDISHAPAEGFAILEDTQVNSLLVYINLIRLDGRVIPEKCLYPNAQRVFRVGNVKRFANWSEGPFIYAEGVDMRYLSIHCQSERSYEMPQVQILVERLLEIKRNSFVVK